MDERSLLDDDMDEDTSSITLHDVSDVNMTDQSECEIVAEVPADPECIVIRASRPIIIYPPEIKTESNALKKTPSVSLSNLPPPCKTAKSAPVT